MKKHTVLITGAAGYVGTMLISTWAKRQDVAHIIALDKEPRPDALQSLGNVEWIIANTSHPTWEDRVRMKKPDIVVHLAWQIRELYGAQDRQWQWNVEGSSRVFSFAFGTSSVKKLIHFSTVASYGAYADNRVDHFFTEEEPFRRSDYLYAEEKRIVENDLKEQYTEQQSKQKHIPQVFIIRPAAITGPFGRFGRIRFGLQSVLSGSLSKTRSFLYRLLSFSVRFIPVTPLWLRQFVHEDDIVDAVTFFSFNDVPGSYEVCNLAPPGEPLRGKDMARALGKRTITIPPFLVEVAFFCIWHLSRGAVPTARGSWKSYSYPIAVDGSKITKQYGFQYRCSSYDALAYTTGRYEEIVPEGERTHQ